jgi:hypothetical protein
MNPKILCQAHALLRIWVECQGQKANLKWPKTLLAHMTEKSPEQSRFSGSQTQMSLDPAPFLCHHSASLPWRGLIPGHSVPIQRQASHLKLRLSIPFWKERTIFLQLRQKPGDSLSLTRLRSWAHP